MMTGSITDSPEGFWYAKKGFPMTVLTRAEKRLLKDLQLVKNTRKALLKAQPCPLTERAQNSWERGVIGMIIRYCDEE